MYAWICVYIPLDLTVSFVSSTHISYSIHTVCISIHTYMDTFLYSFITYVHTYIHACMSTYTNYIIQSYYVCQWTHNYNLTYYCTIGRFRRKHEFSLFLFSFWWLSLEQLLFLVPGHSGDQEEIEHYYPSWIGGIIVCMYVCICVCMVSQYRLFPAPTSPTYYMM